MADEKKKGILAIAFGKPKGGGGDGLSDEEDDGAGEDLGLTSAANAVFTALKGDDRQGFAAALHTYVKQCGGSDYEEG